jgi:hypothetical protein
MDHLSGIEDVWMAVEQRDFATAKRLGRLFAEDLRLLEDLGQSISVDAGSSVHRAAAAFPFRGRARARRR